jgi:GT2 family glycosyltransferase
MIRVDVAIPCYNYAKYLDYCVGTVLSQRDVDVRVLIIDDCSPDDTAEVAARLVASDPRVFYTRNPGNLGLVGTANRGVIEWATAPYTLLLSADDALTPGALARAVEVMEKHPEVGMTYGMAVVVNEKNEEYPAGDQADFDYRVVSGPAFIERFCKFKNGVASPTALVRTSVQKHIGGYNPKFPHTCDVEMWMRFATRGGIGVIKAPQAYYRWHSNNMSSQYINRPMNDLREQIETCEHVCATWGADIPEFGGWIEEMRTKFAIESCWLAGVAIERGDKDAARQCIEFAESLRPDTWKLKAWWGYQAKRLMGSGGASALRSMRRNSDPFYRPFTHGAQFGWWPDAN